MIPKNNKDKFKEKLKTTFDSIDKNLVPKHIGNGIYIVEGFGLMCDENFIEELNNAIIEEVKKT